MSDQWPTTPPPHPPLQPGGWTPPEMPPQPAGGAPSWGQPPGVPPVPATPSGGGGGRSNRLALIVVLALVFAVGAGLLVWVVTDDDGDDAATGPSTPPTSDESESTDPSVATTEPTDPTDPTDPGSGGVHMTETGDAELDAMIEEAARFAEDYRGLEFKEPVLVEALEGDAFIDRLRESVESDEEYLAYLARLGDQLIALGIFEPDVDAVDAYLSALDAGVLGYYDPETKELVVRGGDPTLYMESVVVHELVHALDDQWYDLDRPELDDDDEASFGFSALVEGSARLAEDAWTAQLSDSEEEQMFQDQLAFEMEALPYLDIDTYMTLAPILGAPYELGSRLIESIVEDEGTDRFVAAFAEPPITSEQVLHPDAFLQPDEPVAVDPPPADGDEAHTGTVGEFLLRLALSGSLSSSVANEAAEGWDGDAYVVWKDGDSTCLRVDIATDSDDDRRELEQALTDWADDRGDASVERQDDLVRLTTCS